MSLAISFIHLTTSSLDLADQTFAAHLATSRRFPYISSVPGSRLVSDETKTCMWRLEMRRRGDPRKAAAGCVNAKTPRVRLHDDHLGGRGTGHVHVNEGILWVMCAIQATTHDGVLDEVLDMFTDVYVSFRDAPKASIFDVRAFTVFLPTSARVRVHLTRHQSPEDQAPPRRSQ
jgi:hypothetical protein